MFKNLEQYMVLQQLKLAVTMQLEIMSSAHATTTSREEMGELFLDAAIAMCIQNAQAKGFKVPEITPERVDMLTKLGEESVAFAKTAAKTDENAIEFGKIELKAYGRDDLLAELDKHIIDTKVSKFMKTSDIVH